MKIFLASDLHVERFNHFPIPHGPVDLVVLAGDIHWGAKVLTVALAYQQRCRAPVIVVAGNHEFDHSEYGERLSTLRQETEGLTDIHFLEKDTVELGGIRFLGSTLWSDFNLFGDHSAQTAKQHAIQCVSDFHVIRDGEERFLPDRMESLSKQAYAWLEGELAKPFNGHTVVISHFVPHRAGIHPMHLLSPHDRLTPYATIDCATLMQRYPMAAWFYGHSHNSVDVVVERGTRLVSNQRGYPGEDPTYIRFDPQKIIEIAPWPNRRDPP